MREFYKIQSIREGEKMGNEQKAVLIAEDDRNIQDMLSEMIADSDSSLEIIRCLSIEDALRDFHENLPRIKLILVDGNMPQKTGMRTTSTVPMAKLMRNEFKGTMVAISGDEAATMALAKAGCDHAIDKTMMTNLIALMKQLLLPPQAQ